MISQREEEGFHRNSNNPQRTHSSFGSISSRKISGVLVNVCDETLSTAGKRGAHSLVPPALLLECQLGLFVYGDSSARRGRDAGPKCRWVLLWNDATFALRASSCSYQVRTWARMRWKRTILLDTQLQFGGMLCGILLVHANTTSPTPLTDEPYACSNFVKFILASRYRY